MIRKPLTSPKVHVWSQDPAIDEKLPNHNWQEFLRTGDWETHVGVKPGERLTVFHISPLSRAHHMKVMGTEGFDKFNLAIMYGLKKIDNFTTSDGEHLTLQMRGVGNEERVSEASLDRIYDAMLFAELGLRIIDISNIHPLSSRV